MLTVQTVMQLVMAVLTFQTLVWVVGMTVLMAGFVAIVLAMQGVCLFVVPWNGKS